jgi:hypothetical protein
MSLMVRGRAGASGGVAAMSLDDDAVEARAQGWRTLAAMHASLEDALERALQREHGGGGSFAVGDNAAGDPLGEPGSVEPLSLPGRLAGYLHRVTQAGHDLLTPARPLHDATLAEALQQAQKLPELAPLVDTLARLPVR